MDSSRLEDYYKRIKRGLGNMPIAKAIGGVLSNPTPQEVGAQIYNLGGVASDTLQEATKDPMSAALNYGPGVMGTIVGKGIKGLGLSSIDDIARAEIQSRSKLLPTKEPELKPYMSGHMAPTPIENAPGYDVTMGIFPKDIYESVGQRYYGTGEKFDNKSFEVIHQMRGRPNEAVTIYRAVPKNIANPKIHPGDWVTISKGYAEQHGKSVLNGEYRVISKKVTAKDIYTNGDSVHEWGYAPQDPIDINTAPFKYLNESQKTEVAHNLATEYLDSEIPKRVQVPYSESTGWKWDTIPSVLHPKVGEIKKALIKAEDFLDK